MCRARRIHAGSSRRCPRRQWAKRSVVTAASGAKSERRSRASEPPGRVLSRRRKIVPPLPGSSAVSPSIARIMASAVRPTLVRTLGEIASRVSAGGSTGGAAALSESAGTPAATNGAWLPELVGTARRSTWVGTLGSRASRFACAPAGVLGQQPDPGRRDARCGPPAVDGEPVRLAARRPAQRDDGEEVVDPVLLDEAARPECSVRVAIGREEEKGVPVARQSEHPRQFEQCRRPRGVGVGALCGPRR